MTAVYLGLSVSANFARVDGSGTPADFMASFALAANASCNISVEFEPVAPAKGTVDGSVTLTDNNLNASPNATQTIDLAGTAVIQITPTVSVTPSSSSITTAQVTAAEIAGTGITTITMQSPTPGGGTSNSMQFEVDTAGTGSGTAPIFTSLTASLAAGSTASYPVTLP